MFTLPYSTDRLTTILVEGKRYLCEKPFIDADLPGPLALNQALLIQGPTTTTKTFLTWVCLRNMDLLNTIHVSKESGYADVPLDIDELQTIDRMLADLARVKSTIIAMIENDYLMHEWKGKDGNSDPLAKIQQGRQ